MQMTVTSRFTMTNLIVQSVFRCRFWLSFSSLNIYNHRYARSTDNHYHNIILSTFSLYLYPPRTSHHLQFERRKPSWQNFTNSLASVWLTSCVGYYDVFIYNQYGRVVRFSKTQPCSNRIATVLTKKHNMSSFFDDFRQK